MGICPSFKLDAARPSCSTPSRWGEGGKGGTAFHVMLCATVGFPFTCNTGSMFPPLPRERNLRVPSCLDVRKDVHTTFQIASRKKCGGQQQPLILCNQLEKSVQSVCSGTAWPTGGYTFHKANSKPSPGQHGHNCAGALSESAGHQRPT